jgi:hypothetical protein
VLLRTWLKPHRTLLPAPRAQCSDRRAAALHCSHSRHVQVVCQPPRPRQAWWPTSTSLGGQVGASSGIASAGVRSTSRPSSVPTRPARPTAHASVGVAGTDAVFSTSRVAPDDRLAGAQDATCPESPCCRPAYPIRPLTKPDSLVCRYLVVAMKKCVPRTRRTPSVAHRGSDCPGIIG